MSFRDQFKGDGPNMTDPSTANSRVFVGNIPTNEMTKKDLEERFKKHGAILGELGHNRMICSWYQFSFSLIFIELVLSLRLLK
jgi:RNA recognition motif-containing protein